uniref:Pax-A n=1 Tax=Clytia hemisphaerica TaxID=252671 RepID=A0A069DLR8_9CNID
MAAHYPIICAIALSNSHNVVSALPKFHANYLFPTDVSAKYWGDIMKLDLCARVRLAAVNRKSQRLKLFIELLNLKKRTHACLRGK